MTRVALVTIDRISIGEIEVRNVKASVHERGKLHVTLLGMSFLGKLRRAEMRSGRLILETDILTQRGWRVTLRALSQWAFVDGPSLNSTVDLEGH